MHYSTRVKVQGAAIVLCAIPFLMTIAVMVVGIVVGRVADSAGLHEHSTLVESFINTFQNIALGFVALLIIVTTAYTSVWTMISILDNTKHPLLSWLSEKESPHG